ncbi:hypothetical protein FNF31_03377 [Cafeteria roenbergensis]|uniref:Uncharacterized protein n=1 Tax=Cafeteria roenbergensis TaxID=33653 RepID=A0A5A8D998_CAFRO|nr:hypothetical protein FNF31_03377 [Cafeteria roenbergensis]
MANAFRDSVLGMHAGAVVTAGQAVPAGTVLWGAGEPFNAIWTTAEVLATVFFPDVPSVDHGLGPRRVAPSNEQLLIGAGEGLPKLAEEAVRVFAWLRLNAADPQVRECIPNVFDGPMIPAFASLQGYEPGGGKLSAALGPAAAAGASPAECARACFDNETRVRGLFATFGVPDEEAVPLVAGILEGSRVRGGKCFGRPVREARAAVSAGVWKAALVLARAASKATSPASPGSDPEDAPASAKAASQEPASQEPASQEAAAAAGDGAAADAAQAQADALFELSSALLQEDAEAAALLIRGAGVAVAVPAATGSVPVCSSGSELRRRDSGECRMAAEPEPSPRGATKARPTAWHYDGASALRFAVSRARVAGGLRHAHALDRLAAACASPSPSRLRAVEAALRCCAAATGEDRSRPGAGKAGIRRVRPDSSFAAFEGLARCFAEEAARGLPPTAVELARARAVQTGALDAVEAKREALIKGSGGASAT